MGPKERIDQVEPLDGDIVVYEWMCLVTQDELTVVTLLGEADNGAGNVQCVRYSGEHFIRLVTNNGEPKTYKRERVLIEGRVLEHRRRYH